MGAELESRLGCRPQRGWDLRTPAMPGYQAGARHRGSGVLRHSSLCSATYRDRTQRESRGEICERHGNLRLMRTVRNPFGEYKRFSITPRSDPGRLIRKSP